MLWHTLTIVIYCGVCASEDYTSAEQNEKGATYFVCSNPFHGEESLTWEPPGRSKIQISAGGIGAKLTIWDKLYECVPEGADFVPYGVVEDGLADRYPDELQLLINEYGHRWRDPNHPSNRYSASVYLGARLAELSKEGLLEHKSGPATGNWAYNGTYEWWRRRQ